jgi:glutamate-5-semialdehyde dehydrogenase
MVEEMAKRAKEAARMLAQASTQGKNQTLLRLAELLWQEREAILAANRQDLEAAESAGLSPAMIDRLTLNEARLASMIEDVRKIVSLEDPVGEIFDAKKLPNGLQVRKQRVPLGVLAVIYESRPNVTMDAAILAIKTGNAVILRGGSEALNSNRALSSVVRRALEETGLPAEAVQFIDDANRELVNRLLKLHEYIDMVIPRGGAGLHKLCREISTIPVITGGIGICHLYVDDSADLEKAIKVVRNAKVQRPTVCNALDTVLVHRAIAGKFIPPLVQTLAADGVRFRADPQALEYLPAFSTPVVQPAGPDDFDTEWLSLVLGIKVVDGLDEAIEHIAEHSTAHSDGILTENYAHARRFVAEVDSAVVYVNASTRFTDGGQLGLGAEVAVSTQRLHARGPMGLRELTTFKWVVEGEYHTRA